MDRQLTMAFDQFTIAVIALVAGVGFGAANSIFGWLKSNDEFNPKKFAITVITGIIAGVVLVFANISGVVSAPNNYELLKQIVGLGLAIFGVNEVRTFISGMIANRAIEKIENQ
jgi:hypothetical protein